jgi:hypothetical protein
MRKAELSMNIIIIAAISLLVLVILSVLLLRAGGNVNQGTGCTGVSGQCIEDTDEGCKYLGEDYARDVTHGCGEEGQICCIKL